MEAGTDTGRQSDHLRKKGNKKRPWNDNADAMLYLPGGGAMLFLTDVDHVSFEKANETRQNTLLWAAVFIQI
ncbi:MAG: hypothetical protein E7F06_19690 [Lachnospiraceae bacterium]|nr:hypothetical protein [Lachnospiraceae bacterium]